MFISFTREPHCLQGHYCGPRTHFKLELQHSLQAAKRKGQDLRLWSERIQRQKASQHWEGQHKPFLILVCVVQSLYWMHWSKQPSLGAWLMNAPIKIWISEMFQIRLTIGNGTDPICYNPKLLGFGYMSSPWNRTNIMKTTAFCLLQ